MSELIKLLYEQPRKIRRLILNFLRFILTVIILNGIHGLFKYNFLKNIYEFNGNLHVGKVFLYVIIFTGYWLMIWFVLEPIFVLLIGLKKRKTQEQRDREENQRLEDKKDIGLLLNFLGGFTVENKDFVVPADNIHTIADVAQFVDEDNSFSVPNTLFGEALYILFVGWVYLIFNSHYCGLTFCNHLIFGIVIILLVLIYRTLNNLLTRLKDHTEDARIFLDELEFRKSVMDLIIKEFRGRLNLEKECFDLNWGRNGYHIRDLYYYHEGLGNAFYLKKFRRRSKPDLSDMVLILNFNPNEELRSVLQEMGVIGIVVTENDSDLLDKLIDELNRLKLITESHS